MATKQEVNSGLLTMVGTVLDSMGLLLNDGHTHKERDKYKQKLKKVGQTLDRLEGIVKRSEDNGAMLIQMDEINSKYLDLSRTYG